MEQYADHVRFMLGRTNAYSGLKYTEDPTVMTWEIGNEPRAFSNENLPAFEKWISEVAALIKSIDPNHLVTTGTEGKHGCEQQMDVFERIHANPDIDYLTMHIWPKNWGWLDIKDIGSTVDVSIEKTNLYMHDHIAIAEKLNKPLVLEEFGLPRDRHGYSPDESTVYRDRYYGNAFDQVFDQASKLGVLAGANIWTYSGEGRPVKDQTYWKPGDDYLGDPPVEEQGLNSVFDTDSTVRLIARYNKMLNEILK
jgi:mannan endo-1,4-beta-mannosidase